MSERNAQAAIPEPPELEWRGAPYPVAEPPLVDQEPPDWSEEIEDLTVVASAPVEHNPDPTPDEQEHAVGVSLEDKRVRELTGGERPGLIAVSAIEGKDQSEPPLLRCSFFSCETLQGVEVVLDRASMAVIEVTKSQVQPPLTPQEVDLAVDLGADALGITLAPDLVGRAISVTPEQPTDPHFRHRLADVRYGRPDERRAQFRALVDICERSVIAADAM
jgi:hypothetical protein